MDQFSTKYSIEETLQVSASDFNTINELEPRTSDDTPDFLKSQQAYQSFMVELMSSPNMVDLAASTQSDKLYYKKEDVERQFLKNISGTLSESSQEYALDWFRKHNAGLLEYISKTDEFISLLVIESQINGKEKAISQEIQDIAYKTLFPLSEQFLEYHSLRDNNLTRYSASLMYVLGKKEPLELSHIVCDEESKFLQMFGGKPTWDIKAKNFLIESDMKRIYDL